MSRYIPSMMKFSWIIGVCLVISLAAGYVLAKSQPTAYLVSSTLIVQAGTPGTTFPGATASATDSLNQSSDDVIEITSRSALGWIYQNNAQIRERGYTAEDLSLDIVAANPSPIASTILITAAATKQSDAVFLVNAVASGYQAYKTQNLQGQLTAARTDLQNSYNQYKAQSDALYQEILKINNSADPRIALLTSDRNSVIAAMNAVQNQLLNYPTTVHSDVYILQQAQKTDVTSTSKGPTILLVTGALGLVIGLLIWLLMIFLDNRVRADDQVPEKLGLSYLGGLTSNSDIQAGSVPTKGLAAQQMADIGMNLRLTEVLPGPWRAPQGAVLLVTSAQPVEGKTTVAAGLAAAVARGGRSVLVVDGNLRQPTTHLAFGSSPASYGLGGLLKATGGENIDAAVQRSNIPGVWLLAGGMPIADATLLMDQKLPGMLAQLRQKTDWIIIDGPPVLSGAEAGLLASMSDGVVLVVDARHDKVSVLLRARAILKSLTNTPVGVVMNRLRQKRHNPYYAVAFTEDMAAETPASGPKYTRFADTHANGNGHNGANGQRPEPVVAAPGSSSPNMYGAPAGSVARPVSVMPMGLPVMQPNPNPPSPFPAPRRMDMAPPQQ
ncbi:MAG TPA: AAA family ATPase [Ktedonobacteraceae bacterium]|nr:AAA family ATPase [Ktedonobacteraceae bacterium]